MNILTIHSAYAHHSENSGYKQILKFISPKVSLLYNEKDLSDKNWFNLRYRWSIEFEIKKYLKGIDLIHVLYGEEYLRFTPFLYPKKPLVVTFHLPPKTLQKHIQVGNGMGKIDSLTHYLTKQRFQKIDRAIVTKKNQFEVLKKVMPEEKIRIIPLGIYLTDFFAAFQEFYKANIQRENKVIVLGNWLRDWELLLKVALVLNKNDVKIHLVGRNIPLNEKQKLRKAPNIIVENDLSDRELKNLLYSSKVSFLPLKEAAGNNALTETLANVKNLILLDPIGYFEFQKLVKRAKLILTDSRGIQEESAYRKVPCLTLRPNTERQITVEEGSNILLPMDIEMVNRNNLNILSGKQKKSEIPELWDGKSTFRILKTIENWRR